MLKTNKRIVITGLGALCSLGFDKESIWSNILAGKRGVAKERFSIDGQLLEECYIHKVRNFNINKFNIDKYALEEIIQWKGSDDAVDLFYLLAALQLAFVDSRFDYDKKRNDIGLVLAHENPGLGQFYNFLLNKSFEILKNRNITKKEFFNELYVLYGKQAYDLQTFMFLHHITKSLKLHGYSLFINNACASGLYALEVASDIIKSNKCNVVAVSAADHADVYKYLWFKQIGMYSTDGKIKPFSKNANGFIMGDGSAGIVLEDFEHAKKRNAHIYAEYLGGSFFLEGWKVSFPAVDTEYYRDTLINSLKKARINPEDVDLVVPHGVGTRITDRYEAKAIEKVFNKLPKKPFVTAFKPYIGHNLGGSGLLETVILLLAMEKNIIPPTLNTKTSEVNGDLKLVNKKTYMDIKIAMKTSCAFAGFDASCIFRKI